MKQYSHIKHLVYFSGGVCSWSEGKRAAMKYGPENVLLLTKANCDPSICTLHFGMDYEEFARLERIKARKAPWKVEGLLCSEQPYLQKLDMIEWLKREGIEPPRLYALGFPHNNCGGFCIKAGQAHFALLYRTMPERYKFHEDQENKLRAELGWRQTILRDARGGKVKPLSLTEFRERLEKKQSFDSQEWGGCGCALPENIQ